MRLLLFLLLVSVSLMATSKRYVCYTKKTVSESTGNLVYEECKRYNDSCHSNNKLHFGKYPSENKVSSALRRCKKSSPKFVDSGRKETLRGQKLIMGNCNTGLVRDFIATKIVEYRNAISAETGRAKRNIGTNGEGINKYNSLATKHRKITPLRNVVKAILRSTLKYDEYPCHKVDELILDILHKNEQKPDMDIKYDGRIFKVYNYGILIYQLHIRVEKLGGYLDR